jgi:hypothetical protein
MKKIRIIECITGILGLVFALSAVLIYTTEDAEVLRAFLIFPETTASNIAFMLAPLMLGTAALLAFIARCIEHKNWKWLMLMGTILCYGIFALTAAISEFDVGKTLKKMKSPDNKHTVYYFDRADKDTGKMERYFYIRKSFTEYEGAIIAEVDKLDLIEWEDDHFSYFWQKSDYSDYE